MTYLHGCEYLELNTQVVLEQPDSFLIDDAEVPAAQELPGTTGGRVNQHVVPLERPGHAAQRLDLYICFGDLNSQISKVCVSNFPAIFKTQAVSRSDGVTLF